MLTSRLRSSVPSLIRAVSSRSLSTSSVLHSTVREPATEASLPKPVRPFQTKLFIDGEFVSSSNHGTFETICPANSTVLAHVSEATADDVHTAVAAAKHAFERKWSNIAPRERGKFMYRLADLIEQHKEELAILEALDNGKTLAQTRTVDAPACAAMFRYWAGWADKLNGQTIPFSPAHFCYTLHEPLGVCGLIVPWNLPLIAAAAKLGPCLVAGNTAVLKTAEQTPLSTLRLAELIQEAGFPAGVVNILSGHGEVSGAALVAHPDVHKISFTGSNAVGVIVGKKAAETCKRVTLELGGKNPLIICEDADLNDAVETAHNALFWNEGQACASGSRLMVHEKIYDEFVQRSVERAKKRRVGNPFHADTNQGSLVSEEQMNRVLGYIESGKQQGAKLLLGGNRVGTKGYYVEPTVFADVNDSMKIYQEEIFGPVMCISPFKTNEEALQRANATPFGLAAGVFTKDITRGNYFTRQIKAGLVFWNCYHVVDISAPFGGMKQSGHGREGGGEYGLAPYLEVKNIVQRIK